MSKTTEAQCCAPWLQTDPESCWVARAGGCRYFNRVLEKCEYPQRHRAELERAREQNQQELGL